MSMFGCFFVDDNWVTFSNGLMQYINVNFGKKSQLSGSQLYQSCSKDFTRGKKKTHFVSHSLKAKGLLMKGWSYIYAQDFN